MGSIAFEAQTLAPGLYLVATPIGNLGDVTIRALHTLAACDMIYCEDTRVTGKLLERYGIRNMLRNYHEHNAAKERPVIIAALREGSAIALVSDAGMPLISDPGYKLVAACAEEGLTVTSIPGASAVLSGMQLSALPTDRFSFMGFLPEKASHRKKLLVLFKAHAMPMIFYESPHRIVDALDDVAVAMGERPVAVARELTKLHEEVLRGTATEIAGILRKRESVKGEIVIVIGAAADDQPADDITIEHAITDALATLPASRAAAQVAKQLNLARDDVYTRILKRKDNEQA